MILVDSSAWIEYLRDTGSNACELVDERLRRSDQLAVCDAVRMEILAGARNERNLDELRRLVARTATLPTTPAHYDEAAALYRRARAGGETVRKLNDCLVAAVAIDYGIPVLHADRDFDAIAACSSLETLP